MRSSDGYPALRPKKTSPRNPSSPVQHGLSVPRLPLQLRRVLPRNDGNGPLRHGRRVACFGRGWRRERALGLQGRILLSRWWRGHQLLVITNGNEGWMGMYRLRCRLDVRIIDCLRALAYSRCKPSEALRQRTHGILLEIIESWNCRPTT